MYGNQVGGTLAAAVLGVGTTAAATSRPGSSRSVRVAAGEVGRQLASTGTSLTVTLAVLATLLVVAGLLLVSLARRHAPTA